MKAPPLLRCLAACALAAALLHAFQGMAVPPRSVRSARPLPTNLPPIAVDFRDLAAGAGLDAVNVSGGIDSKKYILEATGSGAVIFDFDNDGLMDVFLVNGTAWEGSGATSHLYRNTGQLRFEDITLKAGLSKSGWGQGACAADYDNDGFRDLFVTYYGHSVLYRNEGNGAFRDVTREAGLLDTAVRWDTGCSFADYDLDGKLDLMVSGYIDFDRAKVPAPCQWKGLAVMCGPQGLPAARNHLFHNVGGKFADVSLESGIRKASPCYGFTVAASDFDGDGYPDFYVACDSAPSLLFHNRKDGTFEETGVAAGVALNEDGHEQAGMGVAVADYDEDGRFDIAKTNFSEDVPNLYHNDGDGGFTDQVYSSGLGTQAKYLGWGIHFLDVDHDGRKELFLVNGHVYPEVDRAAIDARYRQPRLLFRNAGAGKFLDISGQAGPGVDAQWSSRGSAAGDLDGDGSLEIVVNNMGARPSLLKNFGPKQNWLLVHCLGTRCNRDAVGARVYVYSGGSRLSGEVQTGSSFLSQNDSRLHYGLGAAERYERIEVLWPGGGRETFPGGAANRVVTLREARGPSTPAPPARVR